ncbi:MAG: cupin domain-containing protein [Dehalococcoidia bacterium]|nr:cupin domain-containing protein [Dehalococcoidia bacterium]
MAAKKEPNLLEQLFQRRDTERERIKVSPKVIKGKDLKAETNEMGIIKWYLHPAMKSGAIRTILFWTQEIPAGSHSGKQKHQGGSVHYVKEGKGYTTVDDVKHEWEKGDLILIPIKPNGVSFQHFNTDKEKTAVLVSAEPNWYDAMGVDMGSGFEQLENAPEFKP